MKMALNTTKNPKQTSFKSSVSCDNPKFSCEYIPVETLFTTCRLFVCVCVCVCVCDRNIDFDSFYDFSIETWNCSDIVVCFVFIS
jgi:hypothetical protein